MLFGVGIQKWRKECGQAVFRQFSGSFPSRSGSELDLKDAGFTSRKKECDAGT